MGIDFAASRAVLIGVSAYEDPEFPGLRAARNSVDAMQAMLSDPRLCGWPAGQVTVIRNPVSATELALQVAELAKGTGRDGVLLVYYVGHGVLSERGDLYLTVVSTRSDHPEITAVPWETVARELRRCRAGVRLAILDCCFSGQAIEALGADGGSGLADAAHVEGAYTLTATTRNRLAHVPPPDQQVTACTSFTGELRDLVHAGIAGKPGRLTLADLYPALHARLRAKGLPLPNQRGTGTVTMFPFTANAAIHPLHPGAAPAGESAAPVAGPPALTAPDQVRRLLREARSVAQSIPTEYLRNPALEQVERAAARYAPELAADTATESYLSARRWQSVTAASPDHAEVLAGVITDKSQKSLALASVAVAVASTSRDPGRVARLLSEAKQVALSISSRYEQSQALAGVAQVVAAVDAGQAVQFALSIRSKLQRSAALADLARRAASSSPDRAARLLSRAENAALSIRYSRYDQSLALAGVARAFAVTDPHQAGRVALSIRGKEERADCLAEIAQAVLAADPDQAEHLARAITKKPQRASALACIARDFPAADPDRVQRLLADAEQAAESIVSPHERASVLAQVALTIASTAPKRAERLSLALSDPWQKAHILARIAQAMPPSDPRRARLVADMHQVASESVASNDWTDKSRLIVVRDIAETMAATHPDLAVRFGQSITYEPWEAYALACAAHGLAHADPARAGRLMSDAERIVRAITDKTQQVTILVLIAEAWAQGTRPAQARSRVRVPVWGLAIP